MARISDLRTSLCDLSEDDGINLIIQVRNRRRVKPQKAKKAVPAKTQRNRASKKNPKQQDMFRMAQTMTAKQQKALLEKLTLLEKGNSASTNPARKLNLGE